MDKTHVYRVSRFDDYDKVKNTPDTYSPPDLSKLQQPHTDLNWWLSDPKLRDQYVIRFMERDQHETAVYWNDPSLSEGKENRGRDLVYGGEREKEDGVIWCEQYVRWSTLGSYLTTFHARGVALWANPNFEKIGRFAHDGVRFVKFSPNEKYFITVSHVDGRGPMERVRDHFMVSQGAKAHHGGASLEQGNERKWNLLTRVWDVKTQRQAVPEYTSVVQEGDYETAVFSYDDRYLARTTEQGIQIYDLEYKTQFLEKAPKVYQVKWSPSKNILTYCVPGSMNANQPDTVVFFDLNSKKVIREKHYFNTKSLRTTWQNKGEYMFIEVIRYKTKKQLIYMLDICRVGEKGIPIEEVTLNHAIANLAIDPVKNVFCITMHVTPANSSVSHCELATYRINKKVELSSTINLPLSGNTNADIYNLYFSPAGRYLTVTANIGNTVQLHFFDTAAVGNSTQLLAQEEHDNATDFQWDPSGRYFLTATTRAMTTNVQSTWRDKIEDTYIIWTFQGNIIVKNNVEKMYQILWRPRPKSLLSEEQQEIIKNNKLKDIYWKRFDAEADEDRKSSQQEYTRRRQEIKASFRAMRQRHLQDYKDEAEERRNLREGRASDDEDLVEVTTDPSLNLYTPSESIFKA